jgi:hypothetical protein
MNINDHVARKLGKKVPRVVRELFWQGFEPRDDKTLYSAQNQVKLQST